MNNVAPYIVYRRTGVEHGRYATPVVALSVAKKLAQPALIAGPDGHRHDLETFERLHPLWGSLQSI